MFKNFVVSFLQEKILQTVSSTAFQEKTVITIAVSKLNKTILKLEWYKTLQAIKETYSYKIQLTL